MELTHSNHVHIPPTNQIPFVFPIFQMGIYPFISNPLFNPDVSHKISIPETIDAPSINEELSSDIEAFKSFFSCMDTAKSLQKRNDNFEMMKFEISDEEPDDVYNRRKKKVEDLLDKEEEKLEIIVEMKRTEEEKFLAIIEFIQVFCQMKRTLPKLRTDYYSNKTFFAIKNSSETELNNATKVIKRMLENVLKYPTNYGLSEQEKSETINERIIEFLIIPRFLISKEKIIRLTKDEELQKNFQFLVINECLGHYNNEANKKMPEEKQMKIVRELLEKKQGREKFKKICSINHGNKFFKSHGNFYYKLYDKSLDYLKYLETCLKKGKKFESIKKDLDKIPAETDYTIQNSSYSENSSSSNIYSFKSFGECLNKMENSGESSSLNQELLDEPSEIDNIGDPLMKKFKPRKLMSMPTNEPKPNTTEKRAFKVKKFNTTEVQNIILVPPPKYSEI